MLKLCGHQGDKQDPHDDCHRCQETSKGRDGLCTAQYSCSQCSHLTGAEWQAIYKLRNKRENRRRKAAEKATLRGNTVRSSCSVSAASTSNTTMPRSDPVVDKRKQLLERDASRFDSFATNVSEGSKEQDVSAKREKRSRSSSETDSDRGASSDRRKIRARRQRSPSYLDSYRHGYPPPPPPPGFQYSYYPPPPPFYDERGRYRSPPLRERSVSGNSRFRLQDAYEAERSRRSRSRRRSRGRERSRSGDRRRQRSRSSKRHKTSHSRHSSPIADSEVRVVSPRNVSPVATGAGDAQDAPAPVVLDADEALQGSSTRDESSQRAERRSRSPSASRAEGAERGEDLLRSPKEPRPPRPKGDQERARRNLDFEERDSDDENDASSDALEYPFRDVIRLIARHSEAEIRDVKTRSSKRRLTLLSDDAVEEAADYAALTTASGIADSFTAWLHEFEERDVKENKGKPVRYHELFRSKLLKPSFKTYKAGDDMLKLSALKKPQRSFAWLPSVSKKHAVWDNDLLYLEELIRGGMRVISFKELVNQALNRALAGEARASDTERLHKCSKEANKELLRVFSCLLGVVTQVRRDDVVSRVVDTLTISQRARLRHAPVVAEDDLFPEQLLVDLDKEYQASLTTKAMQHTLRTQRPAGGSSNRGASTSGSRGGSSSRRQSQQSQHQPQQDRHSGSQHNRPAQGRNR